MAETSKQRGPYKARVETLQCRDTILDLLPKGYSASMIYERLCEDGKLTMTYRHFCRCLIKYCGVQVRAKKRTRFK